jgi:hypothetical protein
MARLVTMTVLRVRMAHLPRRLQPLVPSLAPVAVPFCGAVPIFGAILFFGLRGGCDGQAWGLVRSLGALQVRGQEGDLGSDDLAAVIDAERPGTSRVRNRDGDEFPVVEQIALASPR